LAGGCLVFLVFYLLGERLLLDRRVRNIPLRICVTGIRGKSSVTRLIAAFLRESGYQVLAKTTGTKPILILPNGEERDIIRKGNPSILEGKKVLKIATRHRVTALVAELMSIQPEYSLVESVQMIRPNILVITNVRLDHVAQMGSTRMAISKALAASLVPQCTVFIPQEEFLPLLLEAAEKLRSQVITIRQDSYRDFLSSREEMYPYEFEENLQLALAVSDFLGVKKELAMKGISKALPDFGRLKAWRAKWGVPPRCVHLVSAFAANDPFSTERVLSKIEKMIPLKRKKTIGLLNLRYDRGDRTLQWAEALKNGHFQFIHCWVFIGGHAQALKRRLKSDVKVKTLVMKMKSPREIIDRITAMEKGEIVLVGMGNMAGAGSSSSIGRESENQMTFETLLIGILIAVLFVEIFDIYPGGIIVPAYLALYLDQPLRVLTTILIAFLSLLTYRLLARFLILFGRRRFVTMILVGVLWAQVWFLILPHLFSSPLELRAIGWIIPGLLANNLEKQKLWLTLASMLTVSIVAFFLVRVILWFIP